MEQQLMHARCILEAEGFTCVLCGQGQTYTSRHRGIRPLLDFLDSGINLRGFFAADKVVGKATAFLYCLLGVAAVYTPVISQAALEILKRNRIAVSYGVLTPAICNRAGNGLCPMETATQHIQDPEEALCAIRNALLQLE